MAFKVGLREIPLHGAVLDPSGKLQRRCRVVDTIGVFCAHFQMQRLEQNLKEPCGADLSLAA